MTAAGQVLHGGARRRPLRWLSAEDERPLGVSWYAVRPGETCSLHVHTGKVETWLVVAGKGRARVGRVTHDVAAGDALVTPPGTPHGLTNTGDDELVFVNMVLPTGGAITTTEVESSEVGTTKVPATP